MKNRTYFLLAIFVIILLLSAWMYLLFFGTPKNAGEVFTDLGLRGEEDSTVIIAPVVEQTPEPVVNLDRPRLRQLTTTAVIGFGEVARDDGTTKDIYYAEAGTGHIFVIDLESGKETRISNTTIPEASVASFSPSGKHVAVRTKGDKQVGPLTLGELSPTSGKLNESVIADSVVDFKIVNAGELLYTTKGATGIENRRFDLTTNKTTSLFTVPFFEVKMVWGSSSTSTHYAYPKPTFLLEGYLYQFLNGTMSRTPMEGFGLTALPSQDYISYTKTSNFEPYSSIYQKSSGESEKSPIIMLPEKCVPSAKDLSTVWCGFEIAKLPLEFPDSWYRGSISFKDTIWKVNLNAATADSLVNTFTESSREIDITNMSVGASETALYFTNKNDNTLWMYEL
jgi:hypothetical protein